MKEPTTFPHEHKAGGMVFRIYSAPQVKTDKAGIKSSYPSFFVKYYEGVNLIAKRQKSWEGVENFIEEVVAAHRASDPDLKALRRGNRKSRRKSSRKLTVSNPTWLRLKRRSIGLTTARLILWSSKNSKIRSFPSGSSWSSKSSFWRRAN